MKLQEPLPETKVNKDFETLRHKLPFTRCNVYDGYVVYSLPFGTGKSILNMIENEILFLNLNLIAELTSFKNLGGSDTIKVSEKIFE